MVGPLYFIATICDETVLVQRAMEAAKTEGVSLEQFFIASADIVAEKSVSISR